MALDEHVLLPRAGAPRLGAAEIVRRAAREFGYVHMTRGGGDPVALAAQIRGLGAPEEAVEAFLQGRAAALAITVYDEPPGDARVDLDVDGENAVVSVPNKSSRPLLERLARALDCTIEEP